jgi:hypothetical protein
MGSRLKRDAHEKALVKIGFSGFGETAFQPQSDLFEDRIRTFGPILPDRKRPFGWQRLVGPASLSALLEHAGGLDHRIGHLALMRPQKISSQPQ